MPAPRGGRLRGYLARPGSPFIRAVPKESPSEEFQRPRDRVDALGEVRADGATSGRRDAVELGPSRIDAELHEDARLTGSLHDGEQLLLRAHPDADLGERPVEPPAFGVVERVASLPDAEGQPDHAGV